MPEHPLQTIRTAILADPALNAPGVQYKELAARHGCSRQYVSMVLRSEGRAIVKTADGRHTIVSISTYEPFRNPFRHKPPGYRQCMMLMLLLDGIPRTSGALRDAVYGTPRTDSSAKNVCDLLQRMHRRGLVRPATGIPGASARQWTIGDRTKALHTVQLWMASDPDAQPIATAWWSAYTVGPWMRRADAAVRSITTPDADHTVVATAVGFCADLPTPMFRHDRWSDVVSLDEAMSRADAYLTRMRAPLDAALS